MTPRPAFLALSVLLLSMNAPTSGQTVQTSRMMQEKLTQAEHILEALTTSNYPLLDESAARMQDIVRSAQWEQLRSPELNRYTAEFLAVNAQLVEAAKKRDLDAAAAAYQAMVGACYSCHRYRKGARLVGYAPAVPVTR